MGGIVCFGEVVVDIYRDEGPAEVEIPFTARPGGAPANVAVAAAKLGQEAAFVGSVGKDLFGDFVLRALCVEGVDVSGVCRRKPPTRTSVAFVEVGEDGDRSFTFYRSHPAADELLGPEDVAERIVSGASFVNFGSIPLLKEPSRSAIRKAAKLARDLDVPVAFDVNFREHLWPSIEEAREVVIPLFDDSYVVKLSDDELSPLLGTKSAREAVRKLLEKGVSLVLVSMGSEGAYYATGRFKGEVPAYPVEALDATGAGDAFLAATLAYLSSEDSEGALDEERVREAVRRGAAAGAIACTDYGAMRALPSKSELERFMGSG